MRTIAIRTVALAIAAAWVAPTAAIETAREKSTDLRYEMTVGTDGKATNLRAIGPLPDEVDQKIQKRVRSFTFEPATVNGVAQPATTTLYLTLGEITLPGGTTGYGITSLATGPRRLANQTRDNLPRKSGAGYLVIAYDVKGRVVKAELEASSLQQSDARFRKWALGLAKSFKFEPETVAGQAVPATVLMPIVFCATFGECPEPELRALPEGRSLAGDMDIESVLKLKTPVDATAI